MYLMKVHHFLHCSTWTYFGPLPSRCGWQEMEKKQHRSDVTVLVYQEEKQGINV